MPDPIQPYSCTTLQNALPEELEHGMCLSSAPPSTSGVGPRVPDPAPSPPSANSNTPGAGALVARFYEPRSALPPVQPSLAEAFMNCKGATLGYIGTAGAVILGAPDSGGLSVAFGAARIVANAAALNSCLEQDQERQVAEASKASLAADCRAGGAIPLTTTDGKVVCARP